jgi:hypothetical protein
MRRIEEIQVEFISHKAQRYDTCGDWVFEGDILHIWVSRLGNWRMELAVAVHEAIEAMLCDEAGIEEPDVVAFDLAYEAKRLPGDDSEPGDSPEAPYREPHQKATPIERYLIESLGIPWDEYEAKVNSL